MYIIVKFVRHLSVDSVVTYVSHSSFRVNCFSHYAPPIFIAEEDFHSLQHLLVLLTTILMA